MILFKQLKYIKSALINIICRFNPLFNEVDTNINRAFLYKRYAFSKSGKYCYFRIPKCANSTIVKTLAYYDPFIFYNSHDAEVDQQGRLAKDKFSTFISANVLSLAALKKKFFLFSFFRNPYSRILSAYLDKLTRYNDPDNNKEINKYSQKIKNRYFTDGKLSFWSFVTYLEEREGLYADPHWAPQVSLLPVKPTELSFLGKVETLDKDLSKLINLLFGKDIRNKVITRQNQRTFSDNLLSQYYNDDLTKRVYKF
jgi:hypothetical protein